jgi:hypothetical protein
VIELIRWWHRFVMRAHLSFGFATSLLLCTAACGDGGIDDIDDAGYVDPDEPEHPDPFDDFGGDGDGDGDGDIDPNCPARDPNVTIGFDHVDVGLDEGDIDINWKCTATEVDFSTEINLVLDCPDAPNFPIAIDIAPSPGALPTPVLPGDTIHLHYSASGSTWDARNLRLDTDDGHLLTLAISDHLPAPTDSYALPFVIEPVFGLCATTTSQHCGDGTSEQATVERGSLAFEVDGEAVQMLDRQHDVVGIDTQVWVTHAGRYVDVEASGCTNLPEAWYIMLVVN